MTAADRDPAGAPVAPAGAVPELPEPPAEARRGPSPGGRRPSRPVFHDEAGRPLSVRRGVRGVTITGTTDGRITDRTTDGELVLTPPQARAFGRELVRLAGTHRRLPGLLWGLAEIAAAYRISKTAAAKWQHHADFPKPLARLAMGPVWDADEVRRWKAGRPHNGRQPTTDVKR